MESILVCVLLFKFTTACHPCIFLIEIEGTVLNKVSHKGDGRWGVGSFTPPRPLAAICAAHAQSALVCLLASYS